MLSPKRLPWEAKKSVCNSSSCTTARYHEP
jgi:hypothetical protein